MGSGRKASRRRYVPAHQHNLTLQLSIALLLAVPTGLSAYSTRSSELSEAAPRARPGPLTSTAVDTT